MRYGAELFAQLKQLLKLHTRQRDKTMMLRMIEEVSSFLSCKRPSKQITDTQCSQPRSSCSEISSQSSTSL